MKEPERIWINGQGQWWHEVEKSRSDIPYRRDTTCVWRKDEYGFHKSESHTKYYTKVMMDEWTYCPYCGGRIGVEE